MDFKNFYQIYGKRIFDLTISVSGLILSCPLLIIISILIKLNSKGPIIFRQKRVGKNGRPFTIYKFRTMFQGSEKLQDKYRHLNEADGPVFKIKNDPRFTPIGKFLSHTGLDEIPQLLNILKGEMSLVGPRPLPVNEEAQIPEKWRILRKKVKPGLVSTWLVTRAHEHTFNDWMKLDEKDVKNSSFAYDMKIFFQAITLALQLTRSSTRNSALI